MRGTPAANCYLYIITFFWGKSNFNIVIFVILLYNEKRVKKLTKEKDTWYIKLKLNPDGRRKDV